MFKKFDNKKGDRRNSKRPFDKKEGRDSKKFHKKEGKKKQAKQSAPKHVYKPVFVQPKERCTVDRVGDFVGVYIAPTLLRYATTDGKERVFQKGQLILNYGHGVIGTVDGRFGKYLV